MKMRRVLLLFCLSFLSCSGPQILYNGTIDNVSCTSITGWAFDWNRVTRPIEVKIWDDGGLVRLKSVAKIPRLDFAAGRRDHGFEIPVPLALLDGKSHWVHVSFEDSAAELRHSPRPLSCSKPGDGGSK
jgi:hypothetical protein